MPTCFVIQPFKDEKFNKRYDDVFEPAIVAAGLYPYRVDGDPAVEIIIDAIHEGIEAAAICFVEVTTDNPNVWYELGYALARRKSVVLVCSKDERPADRYPFDVRHRGIIDYELDSRGAYDDLQGKITEKLKAVLQKNSEHGNIENLVASRELLGLSTREIHALIAVAANTHDMDVNERIHSRWVKEAMGRYGYNDLGAAVGLRQLMEKQFMARVVEKDDDGYAATYYHLMQAGVDWILANLDKLNLSGDASSPKPEGKADDDFPF